MSVYSRGLILLFLFACSLISQAQTLHAKPQFITKLPPRVNETSGLVFFGGSLWTINDSGNPPELFSIDTANGNILRVVRISNADNKDWESLTQDDSSLYIGDFGNNYGNRTDLRILKISKADMLDPSADSVRAGCISFFYPDQLRFSVGLNKSNFDCEAFIFYKDSLHLFSKNWSDLNTKHYVLPAIPGRYKARYAEQFSADGLITDASVNSEGNIVLLGYKNTGRDLWKCICWILQASESGIFFDEAKKRIELGSALHLGQTEGIFLSPNNEAWISAESIQAGELSSSAKLFRLDLSRFMTKAKTDK